MSEISQIFKKQRKAYLSRWGSTVPDNQLDITDTRPKQININLQTHKHWKSAIILSLILNLPHNLDNRY